MLNITATRLHHTHSLRRQRMSCKWWPHCSQGRRGSKSVTQRGAALAACQPQLSHTLFTPAGALIKAESSSIMSTGQFFSYVMQPPLREVRQGCISLHILKVANIYSIKGEIVLVLYCCRHIFKISNLKNKVLVSLYFEALWLGQLIFLSSPVRSYGNRAPFYVSALNCFYILARLFLRSSHTANVTIPHVIPYH